MSVAKHVQGPWFVAETFDNEGYPETVIRGIDGSAAIAVALDFAKIPGLREANARLIAASPELLEALKDVISWIPGRQAWHTDAPAKSVERALAAIAKATGE